MKTAKEMYNYCKGKKFGQGQSEAWALKHFSIIEKSLADDEEALTCFIGLHNYMSLIKHDSNYVYAITKKRIVMAQKKLIGEALKTVFHDNVHDIKFQPGSIFGLIVLDTIKETIHIALGKKQAAHIYNEIHDVLNGLKHKEKLSVLATAVSAAEPKKYKELLETGTS